MHISCIPVEITARMFVLLAVRKQRHFNTHFRNSFNESCLSVNIYFIQESGTFLIGPVVILWLQLTHFYPAGYTAEKKKKKQQTRV